MRSAPSLIIVDSIGAAAAAVLGGGQHSQGHAMLSAAGTALKCVARELNAAVIVTNHLVGGSGVSRDEKRAALGESWASQAHSRLRLAAPAQEGGARVATLEASTSDPKGAAEYWLTRAGPRSTNECIPRAAPAVDVPP
jgi:hypothetical protein